MISTLIIAATSFCLPVMIGKSFNPEKKVHSYKDEQTRENNFFLLGILSCGTLKVERWFQGLPVGKYLIASSLTLTITNSTCLLRVLLIKRSFVGIFGPVTLSKNMTGKCVFLHWNWSEFGHFFFRHLGAVNTITFVDENRRFVTTSDDKSLRVWEWNIPVDMKYIADPTMHSMPAVTPSPNGMDINHFC